jgi:hypothetical protein
VNAVDGYLVVVKVASLGVYIQVIENQSAASVMDN